VRPGNSVVKTAGSGRMVTVATSAGDADGLAVFDLQPDKSSARTTNPIITRYLGHLPVDLARKDCPGSL